MNQQRAIGTFIGQRQAVPIARFLMSWYAFSSEEHPISSSMPFSAVFCRILPFSAASVLCPSAMVREECSGLQERKLAILALAGEHIQNAITHGPKMGHLANFSVFDQLFRALLSFPLRFGGQPKRYMSSMKAARACSTARHRQESDEKYVGFPSCVRRSSQAHLAQATRSARLRRYLIPELAALSTTNVNFMITSVVALYRRLDYTFLIGVLLEEKNQKQNYRPSSCRRRSIGTPRPGGDPVPIGASKELRYSVLDFPGRESYSVPKAENAAHSVWQPGHARCSNLVN